MSEKISIQGIVLKRWDYSEKDQIVSFISPDKGKIQGIAKGAKSSRKRFLGTLDLFCYSEIILRESKNSKLVFIEDAKLLNGFLKIRSDYNSILLASGLLEMVYRFYQEEESSPDGFTILLESLLKLEELGAKREIFWSALLKNQKAIGWHPHFHSCLKCKKTENSLFAGFDLERSGVVCFDCKNESSRMISFSSSLQKWISEEESNSHSSTLLHNSDEKLLHQILQSHFRHQIGMEMSFERFLDFI